jgi:cytochrome P450
MGQRTQINQAPGPRGRIWRRHRRRLLRHVLAEYLALRSRFGDVVRLPTFPWPLYLVSHPDMIQYVLRDHVGNYRKGILFKPIARLQGQGLLTSDGELWRRQRRLIQPGFHPRQIALGSTTMVAEAQAVVHGWRQAAKTGQPVDVTVWMHRLTFRVMGRVLLGIAADALDEVGLQLQATAGPLMQYFSARGKHLWTLPDWVPTPQQRRVRRAIATYNAIVQQLIATRRQALQHSDTPPADILARLIAAHDTPAPTPLTAQQLRDEVITLIGAGTETSALALSWTWYLLAQHPAVAQRVQAEVDAVLGGRPPTLQDLPQLAYCRMVLDEALRLYPPSAVLPRQANSDDVIGGYAVPRDALVLMSQYVTHRHPDFWPEPEQFRPQRFAPQCIATRHRFAYFPFGEGPRVCIGKPFALMEMHLALATIAQAYTLHMVSQRPVVPVLDTTLRPHGGLWMTVHERR